ncbi:hypothetical protein F5Y11DRAFT_367523 [Daldinia sp. FL1419]|nr:hypothetical protein F5Y11DRAFT_367523 [Daldinia sp. FL1419]
MSYILAGDMSYSQLSLNIFVVLILLGLLLCLAEGKVHDKRQYGRRPIILEKPGGFTIGGRVINSPIFRNQTLSCDHECMEYFISWRPRKTSIVVWHSSTTQVWQNRWGGRRSLRTCSCAVIVPSTYGAGLGLVALIGIVSPIATCRRTKTKAISLLGIPDPRTPTLGRVFSFLLKMRRHGIRQRAPGTWSSTQMQTCIYLQSQAAAVAADSGKIGDSIVYLTNSAAGLRAKMTAVKNPTNIKGIVAYESYGCVFPDNVSITAGEPFGPMVAPLKDFKKLAKLEAIQFAWGDHRKESFPFLQQTRRAAELINLYGSNAKVFLLTKDGGLSENTHTAFADMNNDDVADLLDEYLEKNDLDAYRDDDDDDDESDSDTGRK